MIHIPKKYMLKKIKLPIVSLFLSVIFFYAFGFYHLAKFETVDEHFWKFERVPQYWKALKAKDLKKTYVNDKPGITVAILSGTGLLLDRHPENLRIRDENITENNLFTVYDSDKAEKVNFALRFPILIFNGLFLFFFFWIIKKMTDSDWIAAFSVAFMAMSPILVGISQIMNPDSLLWTFSAAAIFAYFALLKTNEKKFIFLTALFTGLSLLSKYSANILFPFFLLIMFSEYFIYFEKHKEKTKEYFSQNLSKLFLIFIGSLFTFSVFLPAVFVKIKYLYRGTIGAPGFSAIAIPLVLIVFLILIDIFLCKNFFLKKIGSWFFENQQKFFKALSALMLLIFVIVILNTLTGQKIIPFEKLIDDMYRNGKEVFDGILQNNILPLKVSKELLMQFYPFVFSQIPLLIVGILFLWSSIFFKGLEKFKTYVFFCTLVPIVYFSALIFSNVSANIRYSIMLYPLFAFLGGIAVFKLTENIKKYNQKTIRIIAAILIIASGIFSLWMSKPFYFNYSNFLLPKNFIITDSWGYGEYEAAKYLNSLPEPEKITIWTDRSAICQFIKGRCIRDYKIDLNKTVPDYFILSRRGVIRHQFVWRYPEIAKKPSSYYYTQDPVWSIEINRKPEQFVKIIKSEE